LPTDLIFYCTKFDSSWGSASDPAGGAHSTFPDTLAGI